MTRQHRGRAAWLLAAAAAAAAVAAAAADDPPPAAAPATPAAAEDDAAPVLYVHLIPHSHCDPGWLESFEGYYSAEVSRILSSVVEALALAPERRFVWAEISFFMRWFETQSDEVKQRVHALVASGQLEFIHGGWVQHDEANPSYDAILAQETEGHEYLQSLFGVRPRIAYAIDPFGHSAASAAAAAAGGYDALVINRIDFNLKDALKGRAAMEFVWQPYHGAAGAREGGGGEGGGAQPPPPYVNASIFTHVLHTHYSAVQGFDFENPEGVHISDWNLKQRAEVFVAEFRRRAAAYRSSHLLVPHGDDFKFQGGGAESQFRNLDTLLRYINEQSAT